MKLRGWMSQRCALRSSHTARGCSGNAAVELAILLPFLILVNVGLVNLGTMLGRMQLLSDAARSGARYGAALSYAGVSGPASCGDVAQKAQDSARRYLDNAHVQGDQFQIDSAVVAGTPKLIKVSVKNKDAKNCLLCVAGFPERYGVNTSAVFPLENDCS